MNGGEAVRLNVRLDVQLDTEKITQAVINGMSDVKGAIEQLTATLANKSIWEGIKTGVDVASTGVTAIELIGWDNISSVIPALKDYADAVRFASPEVGDLAAMFPKLSMALSDTYEWMSGKLGEAVPKFFEAVESGKDVLDDMITSFGGVVAGLAESAAAWVKDTSIKVASTAAQWAQNAAQWAQNAAVTAWNGICGVASAVTTAFGAAMNFLTSPITLVVLGIAALIAIVVLLVKNWDTVKAALITGWEAVKQAFSVAGEWFNTNVIQPLVGFFTGLWDQICLIVTNVTTFISTKFQEFTLWIQTAIANVQAVFMGIDAFLLGVFATDWTNQFGAFGEVLNAFFANVENIWNAVKMIFTGIVDFVKGVFAGDWQKGCQREAVCFRKCCKGAMLPKVDDPRRRGVYLKKD